MTATENAENVLPLARTEQPNLVLLDLLVRSPTAFDVAMLLDVANRIFHDLESLAEY